MRAMREAVLLPLRRQRWPPARSGPTYQRPAARRCPPLQGGRGLEAGAAARGGERRAWWSIYHDPVLDGLERQVDISNQTLKAAEAAFREAARSSPRRRAAASSRPSAVNAHGARARAAAQRLHQHLNRRHGDRSAPRRTVQRILRSPAAAPGTSISGARSAAPSRATSPARRRAPPISPPRGSRRRRTLATDYLQLRIADELKRLLDDTVEAYQRSLEITQNQYNAGIAAGRRRARADPARERAGAGDQRSACSARSSSTRSPC